MRDTVVPTRSRVSRVCHCSVSSESSRNIFARVSTADTAVAHRRTTSAGGFTMLELLIAASLLGLGLVMAAAIFPVAIDQHRKSAANLVAKQVALNAKRLVETRLAPFVDPGRDIRSASGGWFDGNGNGLQDSGEAGGRGPIRGDTAVGYFLLHFETIFADASIGFPVSYVRNTNNIPYADSLNDGPGTTAWSFWWRNGFAQIQGQAQPRTPWFRIDDTVYPPVRWLANTSPTVSPRQMATSGSPFDGPLSRQSYVWHVFYKRPEAPLRLIPGSDPPIYLRDFDPTRASETQMSYFVAMSRFTDGDQFAFQDEASVGGGDATPAKAPKVSTNHPLSLMPVPWRVAVEAGVGPSDTILREWDGQAAIGTAATWGTGVTLAELAPRGSRLLDKETGAIFTVVRSPVANPGSGGAIDGTTIEVSPKAGDAHRDIWLFPPPVQTDGRGNVTGFEPNSPYVTGLHF